MKTKFTPRNECEYPYIETPTDWIPIIKEFVDIMDSILYLYDLPRDVIEYNQIKSKYNTLRIYASVPKLLELDFGDDDYTLYSSVSNVLQYLSQSCENKIAQLLNQNLLSKENKIARH